MKFTETKLRGCYIIEPTPFEDHRGFFFRSFCTNEFKELNLKTEILQINRSGTHGKGTIRGLHYQKFPYCETKVVECIKGSLFDVVVDLRKGSETFLQWFGIELNEENKLKLYVPDGFAHGFQTLTDFAEANYLTTQFYHKESEGGIKYDDPTINISWPLPLNQISEKDNLIPYIDNSFEGFTI